MESRIIEILKKHNYTYQGFYHFVLQKDENKYVIVDEFENFYYGGQDFDNALGFLTSDLRKLFKDDELYLECECPGRWVIVLSN